jgi:hypothetical protein
MPQSDEFFMLDNMFLTLTFMCYIVSLLLPLSCKYREDFVYTSIPCLRYTTLMVWKLISPKKKIELATTNPVAIGDI